jgi:hypothetical protein
MCDIRTSKCRLNKRKQMNNCHCFHGSFVCEAFLHVEILPGHCDHFPTTRVLVQSTYRMIQTVFTRHFVYLYLVEMRRLNAATPGLRIKQTLPIYLSRSTTFAEKRPSGQYLHIRAVTAMWQVSITFVQYTRRVTADLYNFMAYNTVYTQFVRH